MKLKCLFFIISALLFVSCKKFLDVIPKDKQTSNQLYSSKSGFYMAANGLYDGIASAELYGRAMTYEMIDILAKRYQVINANIYFRDLSQYNYVSTEVMPALSSVWQKSYSLILAGNLLADNIKTQKGLLTQSESDIMMGEVLAIRAFLHFDMLRLFGPQPINNGNKLSIPYNEASDISVLPLLSFDEVVGKIVGDLEIAESLLAHDPVITNGPMASILANESVQLRYRQFRFNYYAVKALKARVYLYAGKKAEALAAAKAILADPKIQQHFPPVDPNKLLANYTNPDRVFSSEVLAGIYVKNRDEAFSRYFSSESAGPSFLHPHQNYLSYLFAFGFGQLGGSESSQDYRYQVQWTPASGVGVTGHVLTKYKPISRPNEFDENSEYFYSKMIPLIRLSEVYYIAAECEPSVNDKFIWINEMRKRRGLAGVDSSLYPAFTNMTYFNMLLTNEYMREFYGEGQTFYLLKRLGATMTYDNGQALAVAPYSDNAYRPPLPAGEMK